MAGMGGAAIVDFFTGQTENLRKQKLLQQQSEAEKAGQILKGLIEGHLQPTTAGQAPTITADPTVTQKPGFVNWLTGKTDVTPGQGYTAQPNMQQQLQSENVDYMKNINRKMQENDTSGGATIYRDASGKVVAPDIAQADIAKGGTNYYQSREDVSKSGIKETVISKPEDLEKVKVSRAKSQFVIDEAKDALTTITKAKDGLNKGYFGMQGAMPTIPGSDRHTWKLYMDKLSAGLMIKLMTTMKETSKTGATGFGQLSESEGQKLQAASTALSKTMNAKDAAPILDTLENAMRKIMTPPADSNIAQGSNDYVSRYGLEE